MHAAGESDAGLRRTLSAAGRRPEDEALVLAMFDSKTHLRPRSAV